MTTVLIGLDDTDNADSPGTGRLARRLLAELAARRCRPLGVTRHQFLVDSRIPYTSHNSGACLAVESDDGPAAARDAFDLVACWAAEGADPGVCLAAADRVPPAVADFGRQAACRVVTMDDAFALAAAVGLELRPLGGSGLGVIGALASVGQRAGGNDGRFIDLPGLRDLDGRVRCDVVAALGIELRGAGTRQPRDDEPIETGGWVRPRLVGGRAVLPLQWSEQCHAWVPVDTKRKGPRR